jgi:hypothetical protein
LEKRLGRGWLWQLHLVQDRGLVEAAIIKLAVTERLERLVEIQDRSILSEP